MFDLELLRFFVAWAEPERPGPNELGSAAGATRNVAARNATRRLRDIISSQAGMKTNVPYHGCRLSVTFKTGHCPIQIRPRSMETGQHPAPGTGPFRLKKGPALMEMNFGVEGAN
jgi:hypothetical protein